LRTAYNRLQSALAIQEVLWLADSPDPAVKRRKENDGVNAIVDKVKKARANLATYSQEHDDREARELADRTNELAQWIEKNKKQVVESSVALYDAVHPLRAKVIELHSRDVIRCMCL